MVPNKLHTFLFLVLLPGLSIAGPLNDAVQRMGYEQLQATYGAEKVNRALGGYGRNLKGHERRAAAVLIDLGALDPTDLGSPGLLEAHLGRYLEVLTSDHPDLIGRIGDASLPLRIPKAWDHEDLLAGQSFLDALSEKLADGVITGYDVRRKGVYDGFPSGHTFIYSQSSQLHMQQLAALLESEDIDAWLYIAPKLSAFLYREDWGPASDNVRTLPSGVRVIQGREIASMFYFDRPEDRSRFHAAITRYAKKDEKDEPGLIANSWWQPFYYTDAPMEGFKPISVVVASHGNFEATLTVLEEKTDTVTTAFADQPWQLRTDRVWVNPPFYRFLTGGYK